MRLAPGTRRETAGFTAVRHRELVALAVAIAIIVLLSTRSAWGWAPPIWSVVSYRANEATLLAASIAALAGAWAMLPARTIAVGPLAPRGWDVLVASVLGPISLAAVVGWFVGAVPSLIHAARAATAGGPTWLLLLTAAATMLCSTALGGLLGLHLGRLALAIAPATATALMVMPHVATFATAGDAPTSFLALAPVWVEQHWARPGLVFTNATLAVRLGFLISCLIALIVTVLAWRQDPAARSRARKGALVAWLAPAAVAVGIAALQPHLVKPDHTPPACGESGVCVPQSISAVLDNTDLVVGSLVRLGPGALGSESALLEAIDPVQAFVNATTSLEFRDELAVDAAWRVAGIAACTSAIVAEQDRAPDDSTYALALERGDFAAAVAAQVAQRSGASATSIEPYGWLRHDSATATTLAEIRHLDALSDGDFAAWLTQAGPDLATCSLPTDSHGTDSHGGQR